MKPYNNVNPCEENRKTTPVRTNKHLRSYETGPRSGESCLPKSESLSRPSQRQPTIITPPPGEEDVNSDSTVSSSSSDSDSSCSTASAACRFCSSQSLAGVALLTELCLEASLSGLYRRVCSLFEALSSAPHTSFDCRHYRVLKQFDSVLIVVRVSCKR